jgi:hypothetical protein
VTPTKDVATWLAEVDHDIAKIKQHGIRPLAIVRRLQEAKNGKFNSSEWPAFSLPGRGISEYREELGVAYVILEFRHRADAKMTERQLRGLLGQFTAIKSIQYREFGSHDGASLDITIKSRPPHDTAKLAQSGATGGK